MFTDCKDFEIEIQNGQRHPAFINDQIFGVEGKIRLECNSGYAVNGTNIFVCIMISNNTFEWYPNPKNIPSCVKKPGKLCCKIADIHLKL